MRSYKDIKENIKLIVEETTRNGSSIEGGLGRATEEYWLCPMNINNFGPSYLMKFMGAVAILKFSNDENLEQNSNLKEITLFLIGKLSESDINNMSACCIKSILSDAKSVFEFNWYIIHSTLLNET